YLLASPVAQCVSYFHAYGASQDLHSFPTRRSSDLGFTTIDESDMNLLPDLSTAKIDPFREAKTLNIKFFVHDPFTREPFSRDPRNVARKAEQYLASTGIAATCCFGAEAEVYLFDYVRSRVEG